MALEGLTHRPRQGGMLREGPPRLRHHHRDLGRQCLRPEADRGHSSRAYALHSGSDLLDHRRHQVLAGADDDVLLAPGDEQLAAREVAEVARAQPASHQGGRGGLRIAVVTLHQRLRVDPDLADAALGGVRAFFVHHADGRAGDPLSEAHEGHGPRAVLGEGFRQAIPQREEQRQVAATR